MQLFCITYFISLKMVQVKILIEAKEYKRLQQVENNFKAGKTYYQFDLPRDLVVIISLFIPLYAALLYYFLPNLT